MPTRLNWRFLLGEFFVIVLGVLVALWVDQIQAARSDANLEVEYLESLRIDLDADLAQFDSTDVWLRKQEAAAATVLALYAGEPPAVGLDELVAAVETAGWQYVPVITRNTIDDLRSTGNLRLIRDPALRRSIAAYYTAIEVNSVPIADLRDRLWRQYDAQVGQVLGPRERLRVLQGPGRFGEGITSEAAEPAEVEDLDALVAALHAFPELEVAAGEVLYGSISVRAIVALMRAEAMELCGIVAERLDSEG
jgi:hypothetical protein